MGAWALAAGVVAAEAADGQADAQDTAAIPIAPLERDEPVDFSREIRPILNRNCLACHNPAKAESDLVLETPEAILKGGASGAAIVPGQGSESLLLQAAARQTEPVMPPDDNPVGAKPLTSEELGLIKLWIDQGAPAAGPEGKPDRDPTRWQPLPEAVNPIYAAAVTVDGQYAACGRANQIYVYHLASGRTVARLSDPHLAAAGLVGDEGAAHLDVVQSLAFSPDGLTLASGGYREVKLWTRPAAVPGVELALGGEPSALAVSPDRAVAAAAIGNEVLLTAVDGSRPTVRLGGLTGPIRAVALGNAGQRVAALAADGAIAVWNAEGALLCRYVAPAPQTALAIAPDGGHVFTAGEDGLVRHWLAEDAPSAGGVLSDVTSLAVSTDRKILAVGRGDGRIDLFDARGGALLRSLAGHDRPARRLAFRGDGLHLASSDSDEVRVWDVASGLLLSQWAGRRVPLTAIAWVGQELRLIVGRGDGSLEAWRTEPVAALASHDADLPSESVAAVSPDGRWLASDGVHEGRPAILLREAPAFDVVARLVGHAAPITALAFSADSARLVSGGADKTVRVWSVADHQAVLEIEHAVPIRAVTAGDGGQIAAAGDDGSLAVWSGQDGTRLVELTPQGGPATLLAIAGDTLAAASVGDESVQVWNLSSGTRRSTIAGIGRTTALALSTAGSELAVADDRGQIRVLTRDGKLLFDHSDDGGPTAALRFAGDGALVAAGRDGAIRRFRAPSGALVERSASGALRLAAIDGAGQVWLRPQQGPWQRQVPRLEAELAAQPQAIAQIAVSPDGSVLYCAARDGTLAALRLADRSLLWTASHGAAVEDLALDPQGARLATAGADRRVRLFAAADGQPQAELAGFDDGACGVCFSVDGAWVAGGSLGGLVLAFAAEGGSPVQVLERRFGPVATLVALGPRAFLAARAADRSGGRLHVGAAGVMTGHSGAVAALALTADGKQLVSAGADGMLRVCDAEALSQLRQLEQGGPLTALAISPDGARAAAAGPQREVRVWSLADGKQLAQWSGDFPSRREVKRLASLVEIAAAKAAARQTAFETAGNDHAAKTAAIAAAEEELTKATVAAAQAEVEAKEAAAALAAAEKRVAESAQQVADATQARSSAEKAAADATTLAQLSATAAEAAKAAHNAVASAQVEATRSRESAAAALAASPDDQALAAASAAAEKLATDVAAALAVAEQSSASAAADAAGRQAAAEAAAAALEAAAQQLAAAESAAQKASEEKGAAEKKSTEMAAASKAALEKQTAAQTAQAAAMTAAQLAGEALEAARGEAEVAAAAKEALAAAQATAQAAADAAAAQPVGALCFSPDGSQVVLGAADGSLEVFDAATAQGLARVAAGSTAVRAAAYLADGQVLAATGDPTARGWRFEPDWSYARRLGTASDEPLALDDAPFADRVLALGFSPDGRLLASGGGEPSRDGELKLWNVADGTLVHDFAEAHSDTIFAVDFSADGRYLATAAADKFVKVFELQSFSLVRAFEGHTHHVLGVAWQHGGSVLASSGADSVIKVWNFDTGEQIRTIGGFGKEVTAVHFVGQSTNTLSTSGDKTVRLHDTGSGKNTLNYAGGTDFMYTVAATPDGGLLVAGGQDSRLCVWKSGEGKEPLRVFAPPERGAPGDGQK